MTLALLLLQAGGDQASTIGSANTELLHYVKILSVLGLILALAFLAVHVALPRLASLRGPGSGAIRVVARHTLEPRKNLYVIRVGAECYLVGTTESGMHFLTALDAERMAAVLEQDSPPERDWAGVMQALRRAKRTT
jgi:flagellar biogenesis protein FliO